MSQIRMNLTVDADVSDMLEALAGGNKRMGAYLSILVRQLYNGEVVIQERGLAYQIAELAERVSKLEGRANV